MSYITIKTWLEIWRNIGINYECKGGIRPRVRAKSKHWQFSLIGILTSTIFKSDFCHELSKINVRSTGEYTESVEVGKLLFLNLLYGSMEILFKKIQKSDLQQSSKFKHFFSNFHFIYSNSDNSFCYYSLQLILVE